MLRKRYSRCLRGCVRGASDEKRKACVRGESGYRDPPGTRVLRDVRQRLHPAHELGFFFLR